MVSTYAVAHPMDGHSDFLISIHSIETRQGAGSEVGIMHALCKHDVAEAGPSLTCCCFPRDFTSHKINWCDASVYY